MKAKIIFKVFSLFICLCASASAVNAQVRFDEYSEKPMNLEALGERASRFAEKLAAEPSTTNGFITVSEDSEEGKKILAILSKNLKLKNRVEFFAPKPGVRYRHLPSSIEFSIMPSGADMIYEPTCSLCECPEIKVSGVNFADNQMTLLTFTANISGGSQSEIKYTWKVSAGEIVEGQGTPVIKVNAEGAKEITATVEIGGVCDECQREVSFTTKIER